jgi:transcriptional regulator with XRE-family HTH domain
MGQEISERLETLRKSLNLNYGELAEALDLSRSMLDFIRSGKRKPSPKILRKMEELERSNSYKSATKEADADLQDILFEVDVLEQHLRIIRQRLTARLSHA